MIWIVFFQINQPCIKKNDEFDKIDDWKSRSHEETHPNHSLIVDQMKNVFSNLLSLKVDEINHLTSWNNALTYNLQSKHSLTKNWICFKNTGME
jgi:hypothetical protein